MLLKGSRLDVHHLLLVEYAWGVQWIYGDFRATIAMASRVFQISEGAMQSAREAGVTGNVQRRLREMATYSAPYTHPDFNRRFKGYGLDVRNGVVMSVGALEARTVKSAGGRRRVEVKVFARAERCDRCAGTMKEVFYDECGPCSGTGCSVCDDGFVQVRRWCLAKGREDGKLCCDFISIP
jgi:hypothetical protein